MLLLMANGNMKLGPLGLFNIVDDKSSNSMTDDMAKKTKELMAVIVKSHESNSKVFKFKKMSTKFTIHHSAKDVIYDCKNFIDRNADSLSKSLGNLILSGTDPIIGKIFSMKTGFEVKEEEPDPKDKKRRGGGGNLKTIWSKFSLQIIDLMDELAEPLIPKDFAGGKAIPSEPPKPGAKPTEKCDLHFIRCIKPTEKPKSKGEPIIFKHAMTLQQITYMGVLESIKVKQENFPYRRKHEEFYKAYELLSPAYADGRYDLMSEEVRMSKNWHQLC